jgi:hypothetical protein
MTTEPCIVCGDPTNQIFCAHCVVPTKPGSKMSSAERERYWADRKRSLLELQWKARPPRTPKLSLALFR